MPAEPRVEQRGGGRAGGEQGRAEVVLPVFVGGLLELAPRCPRSGDAGAAINHPPAPPPRPLPPPAQPRADAQSGTGRLERRQAGRRTRLPHRVCGLYWKDRVATQIGGLLFKSWPRPCAQDSSVSMNRTESPSGGQKALATATLPQPSEEDHHEDEECNVGQAFRPDPAQVA